MGSLQRDGNTPGKIARDGTIAQTRLQPRTRLLQHVVLPVRRVTFDIGLEHLLELAQGIVPMGGLAYYGCLAAHQTFRLLQLELIVIRTACIALVAAGFVGTAVRTDAFHIAVGKEHGRLFIEELVLLPLAQQAALEEGGEPFLRHCAVLRARGTAVHVEAPMESAEGLAVRRVIMIDDLLRCHTLLLGGDGDGHAVFIGPADVQDALAVQTQEPRIDVRRQIRTRDVPQVQIAVGVGKGGCDEILLHSGVGRWRAKIRRLRLAYLTGAARGGKSVSYFSFNAPSLHASSPG